MQLQVCYLHCKCYSKEKINLLIECVPWWLRFMCKSNSHSSLSYCFDGDLYLCRHQDKYQWLHQIALIAELSTCKGIGPVAFANGVQLWAWQYCNFHFSVFVPEPSLDIEGFPQRSNLHSEKWADVGKIAFVNLMAQWSVLTLKSDNHLLYLPIICNVVVYFSNPILPFNSTTVNITDVFQ